MLKFEDNDHLPGYIADLGILRRVGDRVKGVLGTVAGVALTWDGSDWVESIATALRALRLNIVTAASYAGEIATAIGSSTTEGMKRVVFTRTVSPNAVGTALFTFPANSIPRLVLGNVQSALTGGGTTVTWSLGTAADPDKYGTAGYPSPADSLLKNGKSTWHEPLAAALAAADDVTLRAAATGGAADGDTKLSVGSVRAMAICDVPLPLADA